MSKVVIFSSFDSFVNVVRSRTPKVTIYTEQAKCMLMENADFMAIFYDGR